jgi:glycine C-acetyltransferase
MTKAHMAMLTAENKKLAQAGLYRPETIHASHVVDFTSQDYLGLGKHERVLAAARAALDKHGLGLASPRAFTGTREFHKELEQALAKFLQVPDAIVFGSGYLANIGFYEALFDSRDCLFCDAMVHPSTAEGIRLSSATAFPFHNNDVEDLEDKLKRSRSARFRAIVTDGVFPMDGKIAELDGICALAEKYDAMVVLDDSLGVGVLGETGRGTRELRGAIARVDVVTGTLGKALGAAGGGYVAGKREVIDWLRQKATPYLFSSALPPPLAGAALAAIDLLEKREAPLATLRSNTATLKKELELRGYKILGGEHPTLAVFVGGVVPSQKLVNQLYERGIHVNGMCYPVVPEGQARVRIEVSAAHTGEEISRAINAFDLAGRALKVI